MPVRENPSFRDLANQAKNFEIIARFRQVIRLFGKSGKAIASEVDKIPSLTKEVEHLLTLPDRFNSVFASRGWIATEDMAVTVMQEALDLAEIGNLEAAEERLIQHFDRKTIEFGLVRMRSVKTFRPRERILRLALEDHDAGRYHASVPVVLAQIDGLVYDLTRRSFYGKGAVDHLYAADTIAGHADGLAVLAAQLSVDRRMTTDSVLTLPYRHGILHGRDLGYDNLGTSAKAFATLLALRPWAVRVESGEKDVEPPLHWIDPEEATLEDVKRNWQELLKAVREHQALLQRNKEET